MLVWIVRSFKFPYSTALSNLSNLNLIEDEKTVAGLDGGMYRRMKKHKEDSFMVYTLRLILLYNC
jgi:hypothetical protein